MSDSRYPGFPKIPRLNREFTITEKIDGSCSQICITTLEEEGPDFEPTDQTLIIGENGTPKYVMRAGSRNQWLSAAVDNFEFFSWVENNADELVGLGVGRHFGEWFGEKINRAYGLEERRLALFNVRRWDSEDRPSCCGVVPVLCTRGTDMSGYAEAALSYLRSFGSVAVPGFMHPEGIVIYHRAANQLFKVTLDKDTQPKGLS